MQIWNVLFKDEQLIALIAVKLRQQVCCVVSVVGQEVVGDVGHHVSFKTLQPQLSCKPIYHFLLRALWVGLPVAVNMPLLV